MNARILVVDDDPHLADLVVMAMRYEGFEAEAAGSGGEAVSRVAVNTPDLLVLDIGLPDGSGLDTCRRLRRLGHRFPIIFLTAMGRTEDRIAGLRSGGDDYLTKPFSLEELIVRTHVVLRRTMSADRLSYAGLEIDDGPREVRREGRLIELSPKEYALLRYLLVNAGRVLTKQQILDHVWESENGGSEGLVHTYVSYLRRKIGDPPLIHNVPRVGYMLRLPRS
ncbi:response regulator transcription factor [Streptosporangium sp. NPDC023963]|uniref:response regulator transcription factor n=1 Tax=Streptosporangium sp. NPDC023963 TaxID=3155608 RepID=UPI00341C6518